MPQSLMRKYVLLMQDTSGTSTFTCSQTHQHSGKTKQRRQHPQRYQLPVRAYGVSPVVGVTLVVNTSRVNCGIIA